MYMMTSSNGNIFRVTGPLYGEFTGPQWRGALMFSLICASINGWVNNGEVGYLRRHHAHYDVNVMISENMKIFLHYPSFINTDMTQVYEIPPKVPFSNFVTVISAWISNYINKKKHGMNYLFIHKPQRCNRWRLGMDKQFRPTLYLACDYLSMLGLKANHVKKGVPNGIQGPE